MLRIFRLVLMSCILIVMITGGSVSAWFLLKGLDQPLPIFSQIEYRVKSGATLRQVAKDLNEQGILPDYFDFAWVLWARLTHQTHIKAGEYQLPVDLSARELLALFRSGKTVQYAIAIPEGWTFQQMFLTIKKHSKIKHLLNNLTEADIIEKLGIPETYLEGHFFPDTYLFEAETTDIELLQRAYKKMQQILKETWEQKADNLALQTPEQALILASIIEKETAQPDERVEISGVFHQRLQLGMKLQTDPTVIYGLGRAFDGNLHKENLLEDTPYNTYTRTGLPPTPIALVGRAALWAAVNPKRGKALFFVATGENGRHHFSDTQSAHECAVIQFQIKPHAPLRFQQRCKERPDCSICRGNF
ncbi:MAG: hypothetical protein RIT27_2326 [Pseudomonadota bacterium]|jgi:UPF0755 protein